MRERTVNDLMDEFYTIVRTAPTEDATLQLEALSRLLVIEYTRRCHSDAKYEALCAASESTRVM